MSGHLALLGDSIFDNGAYTGGEPDVITHLRAILPAPWLATLCAVDGCSTADFASQLPRVPADASHVMVSLGGNDALLNQDVLLLPVRSTTEALDIIGERVSRFEAAYRGAIQEAISLGRPVTVCTIYNGNLDPDRARGARIALMVFNDVIFRAAFEYGLNVVDLRLVCTEPADYANEIEPSGRGGRKIAEAVARAAGVTHGDVSYSRVFAPEPSKYL